MVIRKLVIETGIRHFGRLSVKNWNLETGNRKLALRQAQCKKLESGN